MAIRSLNQLAEDQARLLAAYRERLPAVANAGAASTSPAQPPLQWGKVTQVITGDPQFGPHLLVQPHVPTNIPPTFTPASAAPLRCYPAPGKTVTDYAVNDYVRLAPTPAAVVAERLA